MNIFNGEKKSEREKGQWRGGKALLTIHFKN
jgi:hypothetical protein